MRKNNILIIISFLSIIIAGYAVFRYIHSLKKKTTLLTGQIETMQLLNSDLKVEPYFLLSTDAKLAKKVSDFIDYNKLHNTEETELCDIMNRQKSDKAGPTHNYTKLYYHLFRDMKADNLNIFEVGLGTNNVDMPSNMGEAGTPGASLRGWKEFFPNSMIYGADIDSRILFTEDRIKTYFVDQFKSDTIASMWKSIGEQSFDIIIDDGYHSYAANTNFLENSFAKLKKGGIFIVEDVSNNYNNLINWYSYLVRNNYKAVIVTMNAGKDLKFLDCALIVIVKD